MIFLSLLILYRQIVASLWLAACCLWLFYLTQEKTSGKIPDKPWAMCHGPPGTMASGRGA